MNADKVKEISLSRIVAHQEVQARIAMNKETIEEYAEAMRKGDKFPPLVVFRDDDSASYWLADGFHRYHAAKQIANKWSLLAEIKTVASERLSFSQSEQTHRTALDDVTSISATLF